MKHLKMLGLAAIAALGLMAFVGAATASATTMAADAAGTIHYQVGTEFDASLKSGISATLEKTNGELIATCTGATALFDLEDPVVETNGNKYASGTWITGQITRLIWEGCAQTTDNVNFGSLEIMKSGEDEGEVRGRNSNVTVQVFGVSCTYGTGEGTTLGTLKGEPLELVINTILGRSAGNTLFCPSTGRWTATYILTSPKPAHIVS